jgi:beta-1,4-mannosyltransferase
MRVLAWPGRTNRGHNLYTKLLYDAVEQRDVEVVEYSFKTALRAKVDVFHMHWPEWTIVLKNPLESYGRLFALIFLMVVLRFRGTRIVWTVHNLHPHMRFSKAREAILYRALAVFVDQQIHLTGATSLEMQKARHPARRTPATVIPHGPLTDAADYPSRESAREQLGLEEKNVVAAFVGGIDRYKGVEDLLQVFSAVPGDNLRLVVAGKPHGNALRERIEKLAASDTRVTLDLRFIPEDRLLTVVAASDMLVLPYVEGLNSGTVFLALAGGRPVVVPRTLTFADLGEYFGSDWVRTYEGALDPRILERMLNTPAETAPARPIPSWGEIGRMTVDLFRSKDSKATTPPSA